MAGMDALQKNSRWRFQFKLRSLLVVTTLFCIAFGGTAFWYKSNEAQYFNQLKAEERIKEHGGFVTYTSIFPKWLRWAGDPSVC
jgi:hypothetical protein